MKIDNIYHKPNGKIGVIVQQPPIENLIFEGGGPKGLVYVGACQFLDEKKVINNANEKKSLLENVKNVGGSSAGAMTALVVGLGYEPEKIQ
jgi:NTE family protein